MTNALSPLRRAWDDRFVQDLAMTLMGSGSKMPELLREYDLTPSELEEFSLDPLFSQRVEYWRNQMKNEGFTFRLKAKAQAEELLDTSWQVIHDRDVSPAVKADLIKWTAKMAGYEPSKDLTSDSGGVKINIIMGDATGVTPGIKQIEAE